MYKVYIEPALQTAHIKIINKFNPFTGFQNPTYILKSSRMLTVDQVRNVISKEHTEMKEDTYDIYLLPPGEDPEVCQSYLRMRNRDGKYNLMFEEWVTDTPFIISPRITFEVSVRLLGGLMTLGYTIAAILKRSSHIFSDYKVTVKIDWLEQLNRHYVQVQGKDRLGIKFIADQLCLEGSYIPRTYIEQIQLEKLVNEVMALPDDLKTKLSIDEDLVSSSPKEALSRASLEKFPTRNKFLKRGMSHSYSTQGDKSMPNLAGLPLSGRKSDVRNADLTSMLASEGVITQLSEQISMLNERMDEFTCRIEVLTPKFTINNVTSSHQNLAVKGEGCNGSENTSLFMTSLSNGLFLPNSSSSSQLAKESPLVEEIMRGQRQLMHQLDNLSNFMHESCGEHHRELRLGKGGSFYNFEYIGIPLVLTLAIGSLGIFLFKGFSSRN
ncbi:hypothetical protein Sjap_015230 [Stephania japonica]|uniref:CYTH domain-containing protein n=1 Tax=Stephania japonica TaxID=461633 RepID=A0AAP0IJT2_9MAGN